MFKKYKLAAAMLAAVATGAQAVHVNPDGTGQVLIYPYYNVNNNFQTNLHIVNTQNVYKIIKIRFRESGLSQDVLDFNIYMSPFDVWTGVVRNVGGKANLFSDDNTCTLPANDAVTSVGVLSVSGLDMNTAYSNVTDADAREGYVEVIEVGNIPPELYTDMNGDATIVAADDMLVQSGLKHDATGVPANCDVVTLGWTTGNGVGTLAVAPTAARENWQGNADVGVDANGRTGGADGNDGLAGGYLTAPSGGIYGHAIYLNMTDGSAFVNEATALDNYSTMPQHWRPNDPANFLLPSLASGDVNTSIFYAADGTGASSGAWGYTVDATRNDGDAETPASGTNPWPISSALMANGIMNDFFIDPTYEGVTDWVITFPMRKHGVYNGQFTLDCSGDGATTAGVVQTTTSATEGTDTCFLNPGNHVVYTFTPYNREELFPSTPDIFDVSPVISVTQTNVLPREVNVLQLGTSGVLGSDNAASISGISAIGNAGWMSLSFGSGATVYSTTAAASLYTDQSATNTASFIADTVAGDPAAAGIATVAPVNDLGVPVIGFAAQRGNAPSIPAGSNFGETINHRYVR